MTIVRTTNMYVGRGVVQDDEYCDDENYDYHCDYSSEMIITVMTVKVSSDDHGEYWADRVKYSP